MKCREGAKVFFIDGDQTVWPDVADALAAAAEAGTVLLWSDEEGRFNATYSPNGTCVLTASWDEGDRDRAYVADVNQVVAADAARIFLTGRFLDTRPAWRRCI